MINNENILSDIYESIYNNNVRKLISSIKKLIEGKKDEIKYLNNLLNPEIYKYVKIPSILPLATCSFQLHNKIKFRTNDDGYACFLFNPYFLYNDDLCTFPETFNAYDDAYDDELFYSPKNPFISKRWGDIKQTNNNEYNDYYSMKYLTTFLLNNSASLNGETENVGNFMSININQGIPNYYTRYRLVSASIIVKYLGRMTEATGKIGGSIIIEKEDKIFTNISALHFNPDELQNYLVINRDYYHEDNLFMENINKYSNFKNAYNSYYHKENLLNEGIKMIYFPIDNSYEEFINLCNRNDLDIYNCDETFEELLIKPNGNYRSDFKFFVYIADAPEYPEKDNIEVDIYCNFECIPNIEYLNYFPTNIETSSLNKEYKKKLIEKIQTKAITGIKDVNIIENYDWKKEILSMNNDLLNFNNK